MASYEDMLGDAEEIMFMGKYEEPDHKEKNPFSLWNFSIKAKPSPGVVVQHSRGLEDADGEVGPASATELEWKHGDASWNMAASNEKYEVSVEHPLVEGDWQAEGSCKWEHKVGEEQVLDLGVKIESPDISGTKTIANVGMQMKNTERQPHWKTTGPSFKFDFCAYNYSNQVQVGGAVDSDFVNPPEQAEVTVVVQDQNNNQAWGSYDHAGARAKLGSTYFFAEENLKVAGELRYHTDKAEGFQKYPASAAIGAQYGMSAQSNLNSMIEFGSNVHAQMRADHKISKKTKVAVQQSYEIGAEKPYNVGFDVSYTL